MAVEIKKEIQLEIAHVLFIDIVGYSKRLINDQRALLETLNQIVLRTDAARQADAAGRVTKIPTGDGMALAFFSSPEAPVECALEISRALKQHPELHLRMGIHSGPVSDVIDVNEMANVAGASLNTAQRVMDCGDTGHILLSKHTAEDLEQYPHWKPHLHDLGECEVKPGVRVHAVNLYTEELGNPDWPEKFKSGKRRKPKETVAVSGSRSQRALRLPSSLVALIVTATAIIAASLFFSHQSVLRSKSAAGTETVVSTPLPVPEKSIAVLP